MNKKPFKGDDNGDDNGDNQEEFNFKKPDDAASARDEAIDRVLGNEREIWKSRANRLIADKPTQVRLPFTGESLRLFVYPLIGEPHHRNVWGAMFNKWIKAGSVVKTGEASYMKTKISHGRKTDLYQWP